MMNQTSQAINFSRGVPPTAAFPTQQLQACAAAILEQQSAVVLQYHPAAGYMPLREWLGRRYNVPPEAVIVGNGSLQLQAFVSQLLTSDGDTVLVEQPSYDRAITALRQRGLRVLGVPMEPDGCDVHTLERLLKAHRPKLLYTIPDFQNPSGITTSLEKRQRLVELAEQHDFWILEDNPYRDLRYQGVEVPTLFSLGSERVLYLSSFSKVLSPGMRVGYLTGPPDLVRRVAKIAEDTYVSPSMLSQGMAYDFCQRGWLEPNIARLKAMYRPRLDALLAALAEHLPQARWTEPDGGFYVGVYLPEGVDGARLRAQAQHSGLILSDGRGFFPDPDDGELFLRLPFCALSETEIRQGMAGLGSMVDAAS
jgi:DNA-binding transcriptional MocR family regulator